MLKISRIFAEIYDARVGRSVSRYSFGEDSATEGRVSNVGIFIYGLFARCSITVR